MSLTVDPKDENVETWADFVALTAKELQGRWHFRGTLDNWRLEPSLQRAAQDWQIPLTDLPAIERRMLREFKRAYPASTTVTPPLRDDDLGWLALMQHHGAPTRLLDWTYSPFVAAFFALDILLSSRDPDRKAAVWALAAKPVDNDAICALLPSEKLKLDFRQYSRTRAGIGFCSVFLKATPPVAFVTPVNPYILNERLVVQQGLFLCQGDISRSFEENLLEVPNITAPENLRRFLLPRSILGDAFTQLHRMNISHASLFPGLDGYARRLRHRVDFLRSNQFFDGTDA